MKGLPHLLVVSRDPIVKAIHNLGPIITSGPFTTSIPPPPLLSHLHHG